MIQVIQQGHRQNGLQYIEKREESHMKRTEMKKHFTSMKAAALTMLLSASLMAAAVPASAAVTAALTAPTGLETVHCLPL